MIDPLGHEFEKDIPAIFIGAPIEHKGDFRGVLVVQASLDKFYDIFLNYTSLKQTGEVLVAIDRGEDDILFVHPLRHNLNSAFSFSVAFGSSLERATQSAVQRVPGRGRYKDYRSKNVIGIWSYYPLLEAGIVVKIDESEAFAPWGNIRSILLFISLGAGLLILTSALMLSQWIARPIFRLRKIAYEIGQGNLDVDIGEPTRYEFGDLAKSLEQMTTDLKQSTTSVKRLNEEVEQKNQLEQMRGEMLSRVFHELRAPLAPIKEGVGLILDGTQGEINSEQKEMLLLVQKNISRLENLIESVLTFQKFSNQEQTIQFFEKNINELIEAQLSKYQKVIEEKQLKLVVNLDSSLPKIRCAEMEISKVLSVLMDNAMKFTDAGSISITSEMDGNFVKISIQDEGIGISKEDMKKLFQEFRELNMKSKDKKQGFGLDLVLAKKIVEMHGGSIGARSKDGKGSLFYFTLPLEPSK